MECSWYKSGSSSFSCYDCISTWTKVQISFGVWAGGEIQLTDALDMLIKDQPLEAFLSEAEVHDCGNKHGFVKANVAVARRAGMDLQTNGNFQATWMLHE